MIKKSLQNRNTDKFNYKKEYQYGRLVQDCGVEGNAHISSCESTKITTCYRKTTDRRTLELTKKKVLLSKDKREATTRQ